MSGVSREETSPWAAAEHHRRADRSASPALVGVVLLAGLVLGAGSALATPPEAASPNASDALSEADAASPDASEARSEAQATETSAGAAAPEHHRMQWRYPHFRWWEYGAAVLVTAGNLYMELGDVQYRSGVWTSPLPLDSEMRDLFRSGSPQTRADLGDASHYVWYPTQYFTVVESVVVPLATDNLNTETAAQLTLLNLQALGTAGLLTRFAHFAFGRTRPALDGCSDAPGSDRPCSEGTGSSFFSGHASMSAAGAGLACVHHIYLPFYGDGWENMLPCGVLTASSVTVGVMRLVSDKHWFSDVLFGHAFGFGLGMSLPWLLHYQFGEEPGDIVGKPVLVPWADDSGGGLRLMGIL